MTQAEKSLRMEKTKWLYNKVLYAEIECLLQDFHIEKAKISKGTEKQKDSNKVRKHSSLTFCIRSEKSRWYIWSVFFKFQISFIHIFQFYEALQEVLTLAEIPDYFDISTDPDNNVSLLDLNQADVQAINPYSQVTYSTILNQQVITLFRYMLTKLVYKVSQATLDGAQQYSDWL